MKTYHIDWTNTDRCAADVTSQELADALGLSVAEVEATEDITSLDLENGLAVIEERGDVFIGSEREIESAQVVDQAAAMDAYADALDRWRDDTDPNEDNEGEIDPGPWVNDTGPGLNQHNRDDGRWCRWSSCKVIEKPEVPDADRHCPDLCTASRVIRP